MYVYIAGTSGNVGGAAAVVSKNPAYRADLLVIDVCATTMRDGHASTGKPSVEFVEKLVTSYLSVEEVKQKKFQIIEVERRAGKPGGLC